MTARAVAPPLRVLLAGLALLLAATLLATPADAHRAAAGEPRGSTNRTGNPTGNPTGTASGSLPNRAGHLKLSLTTATNGRIRVAWVRPGRVSRFRQFVVQVAPTRSMDTRVRSYRVGRRRQAVVVGHAVGATPTSGNYSFVRVVALRSRGPRSTSPTKWIQPPVASPCAAAPEDQVSVASFNVRTWAADREPGDVLNWGSRGANVIAEILRSGAHALAIQEASGKADLGFGPLTQRQWILDRLNATDPDAGALWVDALDDTAYRPPRGRKPGHVGTRVLYDASKYVELDSGLARIVDPGTSQDALMPWARLQAVTGDQAPFVLTSHHLTLGAVGSLADWSTRGRQAVTTIAAVRELQTRFGDQVIVAGDLNSTVSTKPYDNVQVAFINAGFYDTYATARIAGARYATTSQSTFPLPRNPLRRDYILTLGPVKGGCGYRNQTYHSSAQVASDHFLQLSRVPLPTG